MPIGEFGGAPPLVAEGSPALTTPMYWMYEMGHASLNPARAVTDATKILFQESAQSAGRTPQFGKSIAAGLRIVRAHHAPLRQAGMGPRHHRGQRRPHAGRSPLDLGKAVLPSAAFRSQADPAAAQPAAARADRGADVRPLRDAAARHGRSLPADHEVYITDWADARMVPLAEGRFDLDDYIDYVIEMLHVLGGNMHVIAVCQPSVPVLAAVSVMEARARSLRAAVDDADGRPDRHPPQSDRGEQSRRASAASTGSATTSSPRCRSRIPA